MVGMKHEKDGNGGEEIIDLPLNPQISLFTNNNDWSFVPSGKDLLHTSSSGLEGLLDLSTQPDEIHTLY